LRFITLAEVTHFSAMVALRTAKTVRRKEENASITMEMTKESRFFVLSQSFCLNSFILNYNL
jgi:hypothetical protein